MCFLVHGAGLQNMCGFLPVSYFLSVNMILCVCVCVCVCTCVWMWVFDWLMFAYIALFSTLLSRLTVLTCGSARVTSFLEHVFFWGGGVCVVVVFACFFNIHQSGVLTALGVWVCWFNLLMSDLLLYASSAVVFLAWSGASWMSFDIIMIINNDIWQRLVTQQGWARQFSAAKECWHQQCWRCPSH